MVATKVYTAEDLLMMGSDAPYELVQGELRDVSPSSAKSSFVAGLVLRRIGDVVEDHDLGYVTGADGGVFLSRNPDTVVAPDVGFVRKERLPAGLPDEGYCPVPPNLAVEVTSPTDTKRDMADKLRLYMDAGVLVWWFHPRQRVVRVHRPGKAVQELGAADVLDGEDVLPGFRLPLADIFP